MKSKFTLLEHQIEDWMSRTPGEWNLIDRRGVRTILCGAAFLASLFLSRVMFDALHQEGPLGYPLSAIAAGIALALLLNWVWHSRRG